MISTAIAVCGDRIATVAPADSQPANAPSAAVTLTSGAYHARGAVGEPHMDARLLDRGFLEQRIDLVDERSRSRPWPP